MHLVIPFEPTPKGVPRFRPVKTGGKYRIITYYHWKTTEALEAIRVLLKDMNLEMFPKYTPIKMTVTFWRTRPKWSLKREKLPCRKPDTSNFTKLIEDCLTGIVIPDDAAITTTIAKKRWSTNGHGYIEVILTEDTP